MRWREAEPRKQVPPEVACFVIKRKIKGVRISSMVQREMNKVSASIYLCLILLGTYASADDALRYRYISVKEHGSLQQLEEADEVRFVRSSTPRSAWSIGRSKGKRIIFCTSESPTITDAGRTEFKHFYLSYLAKKPLSCGDSPEGNKSPMLFLTSAVEDNSLWELEE